MLTNTLTMGRKGRRGTCDGGEKKHMSFIQECRTRGKTEVLAAAHHEGDLLSGLRLPADQKDAAAEEQEAHGQ